MVDQSIVKPLGIIENITINVESWEYPTNFIVLKPKISLDGYPIILD